VNAVTKVNIGSATFLIHGLGTGRQPVAESMGCTVDDAIISFCLNDKTTGSYTIDAGKQVLADQAFADGYNIRSEVK
jgi:hypothetical protein